MKTKIIIVTVGGVLAVLTSYAIGYSVAENSRLQYENSLASPGLLINTSIEKVTEQCESESATSEKSECDNLRIINIHSYYDDAQDQENYVVVFSTTKDERSDTRVYVATAGRESKNVEIERDSVDLLDNGQPVN